MRTLHRPVWEGMQNSLNDIFVEGWPADKVIQRQLKFNKKWGSQDRRLFAESVYDMVRWWRKLLFASGVEWPSTDCWKYKDANAFGLAIETWCILNDVELGKNIPRSKVDADHLKRIWNEPSLPRAVRESIPDWMEKWGAEELGDRWDRTLAALNSVAPVYLRANRLKTTPEQLLKKLRDEKIDAELAGGDALKLTRRANVFLTKSFHAGLFEVQDLSSQGVAPELLAEKGQRVIDACAGAGGKSLHLAALMGNKGKIIAMDVHEKKLEQLRERATRNGATSIEVRHIEGSKTIKRLADSCDRLLLDVPCSGMGVLRRNPDSKWKLSVEEVGRLRDLQSNILSQYSQMCKPGGYIVYATCSIMPSENLKQVERFLSQNETAFSLEKHETTWPEKNGRDGFFFARIKRS